jgi:hypothetical protein
MVGDDLKLVNKTTLPGSTSDRHRPDAVQAIMNELCFGATFYLIYLIAAKNKTQDCCKTSTNSFACH